MKQHLTCCCCGGDARPYFEVDGFGIQIRIEENTLWLAN